MHAGTTVEIVVDALRRDPAAVLCDNPNCDDCVMQRAEIKAHDLAKYDFAASALLDELVDDLRNAAGEAEHPGGLQAVRSEGIDTVELGPELSRQFIEEPRAAAGFAADLADTAMTVSCIDCGLTPRELFIDQQSIDRVTKLAEIAPTLDCRLLKVPAPPPGTGIDTAISRLRAVCEAAGDGITVVFENRPATLWSTGEACEEPLLALAEKVDIGFAFNPAHFANVGEKPFLETWRKTKLKHFTRIIYVTDGCFPGRAKYTLPLKGNGEIKEIISIFRAAGFEGFTTLKMGDRRGNAEFRRQAAAFQRLLETS